MKSNCIITGILLRYSLLLLVIPALGNTEKTTSFKTSFKKGIAFLDAGKSDSAIQYFVNSFSSGLSRDSLFYFWAEALLQKNVLDSSLAANFMIKAPHNDIFTLKVLKQRQSIYERLGWKNEAQALDDTIYAIPEYKRKAFIPELSLNLYAGYARNAVVSDTSSPWGSGYSTFKKEQENNLSAGFDVSSAWQKKRKQKTYSAGVGVSANRYTREITQRYRTTDSIDITGSISGSLTGANTAVTVHFSANRRFDDSLFIGASVEGGIVGPGKWLPMLWSGASIYLKTDASFSNARGWLLLSARQKVRQKFSISYQTFFNLMISEKTEIGQLETVEVLYAENARLQYPVFYTDKTCSTIIDTSLYTDLITGEIKKNIVKSATDTNTASVLVIFNTYMSITPRVSLQAGTKFPIKFGIGWRLNYYPGKYEWDVIIEDPLYIVYSKTDDAFYWIPANQKEIVTITGENGGIAISPSIEQNEFYTQHHSMLRIDNAVSADFSIQVYDGKIGNGIIRSAILKNWSTLSGKIPIDIQNWNFSLFFEWNFKTKNWVYTI